jgi:nucleotide-binding universal stress UspA family protein
MYVGDDSPSVYERILVPTDGSVGSAHVAMQAIDLAEQYDAAIHVVHVIEEPASSLVAGAESRDKLEERGEQAIERVETMARIHGIDVETELLEGSPADTILNYAEEADMDLVVTGTHGRSGVKRHIIGSVAERLVRHATCPVMTVRLPGSDETVDGEEHAQELAEAAIADEGHDAAITGVDRQVSVWVVEAESDTESLVVYVDPVTQRTSVVVRD